MDEQDDRPVGFVDPFERDLVELRERIVFVAHELFDREESRECRTLLRDYLAALDWHEVARRAGSTHAAMRKRWSRCLNVLRDAIRRDPELSSLLE